MRRTTLLSTRLNPDGWSRLFHRTKPLETILEEAERPHQKLKRNLTAWDLSALGIGAIIGTGIFVLIGTAIVGDSHRPGAGPGVILSFLIAGLVCALAALCYAEFAAMIPVAGSAYTYTYATLGELLAWLTGWNLILEYGVACATVAIGWSGYFLNILHTLGVTLPAWATYAPGADEAGGANLVASVAVLIITGLLVLGTKESARATIIIVVVKVAVIGLFLAIGLGSIEPTNWTPFLPNGWHGVGAAAAIVFFAYVGFDAVSTTAEEAQRPQRDMPIGILGSLGVCTLLYMLVAVVLTGLMPAAKVDIRAPIAHALQVIGFNWGAALVATGALAGITSVLIVLMIGQVRIFFAMARDGLISPSLAHVHPRFHTPVRATLLTGIGVAILAAFVPLGESADMSNIGTLFAFFLVCTGVTVLRYTRPHHPRPFRLPLAPWLPILGAVACLGLMLFLPGITWIRFAVWTVLGIVIYLLYGFRNSRFGRSAQTTAEPRS